MFFFKLKYSKDTINIRIVVIYLDYSMESSGIHGE